MVTLVRVLLWLAVVTAIAGCSEASAPSETAAPSRTLAPSGTTQSTAVQFNEKLHDELMGMLKRDQSERTGGPLGEGDEARTARLKEIVAEHGWPTIDLVGEDGEDAAWVIAQHSDLDPEFQQRALVLLRDAVAEGQASPGNLAYLEDRVAVAQGQPQLYGTQIQCSKRGPVPLTPIKNKAEVEMRRADAGLEPLADYIAEMRKICDSD